LQPLVGKYGIFTMIVGTIFATVGAIAVGGTLGYFTAIYLAKFCPKRLKKALNAFINLLAGIPSVVYGFFGMKVLLPALGGLSSNGSGGGLLAVSLILGIMILPTIVALSKTSIEAVPESYYEGARALGVSHEQAIFKAIVPAARSGIVASFILGIGRALGETMAVVMVAGNSVTIPNGLFSSFRTMTANIVLEMGYAGEVQMSALIATGVVLLFFIVVVNLLFHLISSNSEKENKTKKSSRRYFEVNFSRLKTEKIGKVLSVVATSIATISLLTVVGFILINGLPYINWTFLSSEFEYGGAVTIFPSIVATLMLIVLCIALAIPLSLRLRRISSPRPPQPI
ncbi:MAG: phosphate ABC transporter permease subunit PstC, partial [Clostridia bacterium]